MKKPRLIYYNDGHHYHAKRIEPPASIHMLHWPADEVAGTGVDTLVLGLGYGDVFFHQTQVGRVVGQQKEVWEGYIDWRIMRMVEEAARLGTDQVREVSGALDDVVGEMNRVIDKGGEDGELLVNLENELKELKALKRRLNATLS